MILTLNLRLKTKKEFKINKISYFTAANTAQLIAGILLYLVAWFLLLRLECWQSVVHKLLRIN